MKPDSSTRHVPVGGAATVNGVLYQMLWSLLQTSKATLVRDPILDGNLPTDVVLILEPDGGGGDLVIQNRLRRCVEQLKARPDETTWSLREVIESVIPDLYLAFEEDVTNVDYRFVTEGKMGQWKAVYKFFHSLRIRESSSDDDPLSDLDAETELKFGRRKAKKGSKSEPFWDDDSYTEQSLFLKIVEQVRKRRAVQAEPESVTRERLRQVLGNFYFVGRQRMDLVQNQIDAHLLSIVDRNDDVPQIRDALTFELSRQATAGGAEIVASEFFSSQGLRAIPLSDLGRFRKAVQAIATKSLARLGYDAGEDVRLQGVQQCVARWAPAAPVLAVTGDSGCGKSWRALAICELEQVSERISVVIQAAETVDTTLERAAREIWQTAAGHDEPISLQQIGRRLKDVIPGVPSIWLTLVVDGFLDMNQTQQLIGLDWEAWGIRVVVCVPSGVAQQIERQSRGRCQLEPVGDFTDNELHQYLHSLLGDLWPRIPQSVRHPLRKPLLASIYRSVVEANPAAMWSPQSEYQLFQVFWEQVINPVDQACLIALGTDVLDQSTQSWSVGQLRDLSGETNSCTQLEAAGWLRRVDASIVPSYEFSHFRLINWACAVALFSRYMETPDLRDEIEQQLHSYLWWDANGHRPQLGFVTMDFLWLACNADLGPDLLPRVIQQLAADNWSKLKQLYSHVLPTLGPPILPALASLLKQHAPNGVSSTQVADAIGAVGGTEAADIGKELLGSNDPLIQIRAPLILTSCPTEAALDDLWKLHVESQREPERFLAENENGHKHFLYQDTFDALKACSENASVWIEQRIAAADPSHDRISDLAYLLTNQPFQVGQAIWLRHKRILFEKMPENRRRSLAMCIDRFVDTEELQWLVSNLSAKEDMLGAVALRALARLDPASALAHLGDLDPRSLSMARGWIANELFCTVRTETQDALRNLMVGSEQLWTIAQIYDGRFQFVDVGTLDVLLSQLKDDLEVWLSSPAAGATNELFQQMRLLVQANTLPQLRRLSTYAETELEQLLTAYVQRIGPQTGPAINSLTRAEALGLLQRINGHGFVKAINGLLQAEMLRGRAEGIELALRANDDETIEHLGQITRSDEKLDGEFYWEQPDAAVALAEHGKWSGLIALARRIGLQLNRDATDLPRYGMRPDPSLLKEVVELVRDHPEDCHPGDLLALGFGGDNCVQVIASYIKSYPPISDHAQACTISLELLRDSSVENVPFLRAQLDVAKNDFSATNALIANGTPEALDALSDFAGESVDGAVAINLIRNEDTRSTAIERTVGTLHSQIRLSGQEIPGRLYQVICHLDEPDALEILSDEQLLDVIRSNAFADEGSSWHKGSKASAIRCLEFVDSHAAYVAAKAVVSNPKAKDRDYYPSILVEIDGKNAFDFLFNLLARETDKKEDKELRWAIGLSLADSVEQAILDLLYSKDPVTRRNACFLSRFRLPTAELEAGLREQVSDHEDLVSREAAEALIALANQREASLLMEEILQTADRRERWLFLDCLLELADPGNHHHQWPLHGPEIGSMLSLMQNQYVDKRLKKRREDQFK